MNGKTHTSPSDIIIGSKVTEATDKQNSQLPYEAPKYEIGNGRTSPATWVGFVLADIKAKENDISCRDSQIIG